MSLPDPRVLILHVVHVLLSGTVQCEMHLSPDCQLLAHFLQDLDRVSGVTPHILIQPDSR